MSLAKYSVAFPEIVIADVFVNTNNLPAPLSPAIFVCSMLPSVLLGVPILVIVPFTPALDPNVNVPVEFLIQTLNLFNAVNCVNTTVAVFDVTSSLTTSPGAGK